MRGLNRVALTGNLGKDPEVQTLEGGQTVAKFSLATSLKPTKTGKAIALPKRNGIPSCCGAAWHSWLPNT